MTDGNNWSFKPITWLVQAKLNITAMGLDIRDSIFYFISVDRRSVANLSKTKATCGTGNALNNS